jgi:outer membrane protein OmpA-like peptidoglycan-associated protein
VDSVESGVEANEQRIGDLKSETDSRLAALDSKTQKAVEVGSTALNKAESAEAKAEKAARGKLLWTVTLTDDRVRFSFGQASLPDEAANDLEALAKQIKSYGKALYVEIEGHTDSAGDENYNYDLGEKRATAVRNYLAEKGGIPLHAMNVISYGEGQPLADNSTREGRAQNRRVVIRVLE